MSSQLIKHSQTCTFSANIIKEAIISDWFRTSQDSLLFQKRKSLNSVVPQVPTGYVLVHLGVVLCGHGESQHATHHSAAVKVPAQVAHLPPPPSMLHLQHTFGHQLPVLGGGQDGPQTDIFESHPVEGLWAEDEYISSALGMLVGVLLT